MKQCPACQRSYTDDLSFCLEDGTSLVPLLTSEVEEETRFARLPQSSSKYDGAAFSAGSGPGRGRSRGFTVAVTAVFFIAGASVLVVAGVGGFLYFRHQKEQVVNIPLGNSKTPEPVYTPTPGQKWPGNNGSDSTDVTKRTPSPTPTPSPSPTPTATPKMPPAVGLTGPEDDHEPIDEPEAEGRRRPGQISGGVLNGKATYLPKPPYPPAARAVRASGAVTVRILVDEDGNVVRASAVSGHPLLRAAAVQAARSAAFSPTYLSGRPVRVSGVIVYNFAP